MRASLWLLAAVLLLLNSAAYAEGNCPPGYYPIGAPSGQGGPQGCAPIPNQGNQQQPQPEVFDQQPPATQWADRWGAIATYEPNGSLGTATDMATKSSAVQAALEDCESQHGSTCKIQIAYSNQCAAMVVGGAFFNIKAGLTVQIAEEAGLKMCKSSADDCHVYYSACSLAVKLN